MHEAAVKKRPQNARLLAELGADTSGRDGHGMTALDYCGAGSAVGRAIREGCAVWGVRRAVRRLLLLSTASVGAGAAAAGNCGGGDCDGGDGGSSSGSNKRRKPNAAAASSSLSLLSWREARRQRGRPLPAVAFLVEGGGGKKAAALRETARLLRAVFVHIPLDVRRQIVAFV